MKKLILLTFALGLTACSSILQRHPRSGYYGDEVGSNTTQEFFSERDDYQESLAKESVGLHPTQPMIEQDYARLENRLTVQRLENQLQTAQEKKQYYAAKPYFKSDFERAEFLSLPNEEARERYMAFKNFVGRKSEFSPQVQTAIEGNDIVVGMTPQAVQESWGEPEAIEAAGNPLYGNERWKYSRMAPNSTGYERQTRIIYFEAGRVSGWEQN